MLDKLFLLVLDMSLKAALVISLLLPLRLLLRRAPRWILYALWGVVLLRLLCPAMPRAPLSLVPEVPSVSGGYVLAEEPISPLGAGFAAYRLVGDAVNGGLGIQHVPTTERDADGMTRYVSTDWWNVFLLSCQYLWLGGILLMLLRSLRAYQKLRRRLLDVQRMEEGVFLASGVDVPFVMGILRPKIYLPRALSEAERDCVLCHERCHICRLDHIWKLLSWLALCIHWFNPMVWLAFRLSARDMEMSCDEAVLRKLGPEIRADYAASLLRLSAGETAAPLAFGKGDTGRRIRNLAKWKKPRKWAVAAAVLLCVPAAVCLLTDPLGRHSSIGIIGGADGPTSILVSGTWSAEKAVEGTAYVPVQCLYMNPLSSTLDWGGDNGCRYLLGKKRFAEIRRDNGAVTLFEAEGKVWKWQKFPFTEEEWQSLFLQETTQTAWSILERFEQKEYLSISDRLFLLRLDGQLWLCDNRENPQMGQQLWSIYRLVPEVELGGALWEYAPMLDSRAPCFTFRAEGVEERYILSCSAGEAEVREDGSLCWYPGGADGGTAESAVIRFAAYAGERSWQPTLYLASQEAEAGRRLYTAEIAGADAVLTTDVETGHAVILCRSPGTQK